MPGHRQLNAVGIHVNVLEGSLEVLAVFYDRHDVFLIFWLDERKPFSKISLRKDTFDATLSADQVGGAFLFTGSEQ
jgi:hypothetical protein